MLKKKLFWLLPLWLTAPSTAFGVETFGGEESKEEHKRDKKSLSTDNTALTHKEKAPNKRVVNDKLKIKPETPYKPIQTWYTERKSKYGQNSTLLFAINKIPVFKKFRFQNITKYIKKEIDGIFPGKGIHGTRILILEDPECLYNDLENKKNVFNNSTINGENMHQNEYLKDSETAKFLENMSEEINELKITKKNKFLIILIANPEYRKKIEDKYGVDLASLPLHKFLPEEDVKYMILNPENALGIDKDKKLTTDGEASNNGTNRKRYVKSLGKQEEALIRQENAPNKPAVNNNKGGQKKTTKPTKKTKSTLPNFNIFKQMLTNSAINRKKTEELIEKKNGMQIGDPLLKTQKIGFPLFEKYSTGDMIYNIISKIENKRNKS